MSKEKLKSKVVPSLARAAADLLIAYSALIFGLLAAVIAVPEARQSPALVIAEAMRPENWRVLLLPLFLPAVFVSFRLYASKNGEGQTLRVVLCAAFVSAALIAFGGLALNLHGIGLNAVYWAAVLTSIGTVMARMIKRNIIANEPIEEMRANRTVLVVGGAGYIGAIVVRRLLQKGYRVRVLDSLVYGDYAIREILGHNRLEFQRGDCRNLHDVVQAMAGVGSVIHLAAIVGDPACEQERKVALETNYAATRMMIEIAKGERVKRFIFASSCSVYGASDQTMFEDSAPSPISLYAETKVDSEQALLAAKSENFHPTILRFSTIFGLAPRPRFDLVVNLLAARAIQEKTVTIFNGEQWRPFLHVSDAAEAVLASLQAPVETVGGEVFNVGDSRLNYCLSDIGKLIVGVFPGTTVENVENNDRRSYRVSFDKIHSLLGFRCKRSIEDGLMEIKTAYERREITDYHDAYYSNVQYLRQNGSPGRRDEKDAQVMAAFAGKASA